VTEERLRVIWNQHRVPVILNRGKGKKPRLRIPYSVERPRAWIKAGHRLNPVWCYGDHYWEIPSAWFSEMVRRCIFRFGSVYVIQPYHEHEVCAPACWNARRDECECSCMGANHGRGRPEGHWTIISEAFAIRQGDETWACRQLGPQDLKAPDRLIRPNADQTPTNGNVTGTNQAP
jgi:hypothetical protein